MSYVTPDTVTTNDVWTESRWDTQVRANFIDHEQRIGDLELSRFSSIRVAADSVAIKAADYAVPAYQVITFTDTEFTTGDFDVTGSTFAPQSSLGTGTHLWWIHGYVNAYESSGTKASTSADGSWYVVRMMENGTGTVKPSIKDQGSLRQDTDLDWPQVDGMQFFTTPSYSTDDGWQMFNFFAETVGTHPIQFEVAEADSAVDNVYVRNFRVAAAIMRTYG